MHPCTPVTVKTRSPGCKTSGALLVFAHTLAGALCQCAGILGASSPRRGAWTPIQRPSLAGWGSITTGLAHPDAEADSRAAAEARWVADELGGTHGAGEKSGAAEDSYDLRTVLMARRPIHT